MNYAKLDAILATADALRARCDSMQARVDATFNEAQHPRAADGKFGSGGGKLDVSQMKQVGKKLGSNPGGVFEHPNGEKHYVKFSKSEDHAKNEHLASRLYDLAGSPALKVNLAGTGQGKTGTATKWQAVKPINPGNAAERKAAQENFATHAWLSNWDAAGLGYDNQGSIDGKMHTLDVGGALNYRAQGGPKGAAFGNSAGEWDTLRHPSNAQAHKLYGSMTAQDLKQSAQKVLDIPDDRIRQEVLAHGPGGAAERAALAEKLIQRKADIRRRVGALA